MTGQVLQEVEHHPYLRIEFANDLSWNYHVNNCTQKAHRFSLEGTSACAQSSLRRVSGQATYQQGD